MSKTCVNVQNDRSCVPDVGLRLVFKWGGLGLVLGSVVEYLPTVHSNVNQQRRVTYIFLLEAMASHGSGMIRELFELPAEKTPC